MKIQITLISLLALARVLIAGGADGAGGDTSDLSGSAWFPQTRTVFYCIDSDAKFGISADEADKHFQAAVVKWKEYFSWKTRSQHNTLYQREACGPRTDLKIYLGKETEEVVQAKKRYIAPVSLAERTSFDYKQSWGRGFIWVSSSKSNLGEGESTMDWSTPLALQAAFTHELGHVLGCGHFEGTIMSADIPRFFTGTSGSLNGWEYVSRIDHDRELLNDLHLETTYDGTLSDEGEPKDMVTAAAQMIFGHPAKESKVKGQLTLIPKGGTTEATARLVFNDGPNQAEVKIHLPADQVFFELSGSNHFRHTTAQGSSNEISRGRVAIGTAVLPNGLSYPIQFEQNSRTKFSPLLVRLLVNGKKLPLFESIGNRNFSK